jgi:hypothetical protein
MLRIFLVSVAMGARRIPHDRLCEGANHGAERNSVMWKKMSSPSSAAMKAKPRSRSKNLTVPERCGRDATCNATALGGRATGAPPKSPNHRAGYRDAASRGLALLAVRVLDQLRNGLAFVSDRFGRRRMIDETVAHYGCMWIRWRGRTHSEIVMTLTAGSVA